MGRFGKHDHGCRPLTWLDVARYAAEDPLALNGEPWVREATKAKASEAHKIIQEISEMLKEERKAHG